MSGLVLQFTYHLHLYESQTLSWQSTLADQLCFSKNNGKRIV
jgi:hypothetical protein